MIDDFNRRVPTPTPTPNQVPGPAPTLPLNPTLNPIATQTPVQPHLLEATYPESQSQPIAHDDGGRKSKPRKKRWLIIILSLIAVLTIATLGALFWYKTQLSAVGSDKSELKKIVIVSGSTPDQIGKMLKSEAIIRDSLAFDIFLRLSGQNSKLQAGTYRLSPAETTPEIVSHLVNGSVDEFSITFLPGGTLNDAKKVLKNAGFSDDEVNSALKINYSSPLFDAKPKSADLEGYIYGQTLNFNSGATVRDILQRFFDEFYDQIKDAGLIASFKANDLDLYQAITLASIIQREVSNEADQKQVAQVFYSRLHSDMVLGSDVTYQYIADKTGVERDINLDSPYNTRRYKGLPPGPISTPGMSALRAVANPADGDYLYFLSGDDDVTYFARTYAQHEANIENHCKVKCSIQ